MSDDEDENGGSSLLPTPPPPSPQPPPFTEDDFLSAVLAGEMSLTPTKLLALSDATLLHYSLLVASIIGHLGSLVGSVPSGGGGDGSSGAASKRRDSSIANPHFLSLLQAFAARCMTSRPLKLRFALLMNVADLDVLKKFWHPVVVHDPDCYEAHNLNAMLDGQIGGGDATSAGAHFSSDIVQDAEGNVELSESQTKRSIAAVTADDLLQSNKLLHEYATRRFFHPRSGIVLKTKRRGLYTYPKAFSEYNALLFLMQDLKVSERSVASAVGSRMVEVGIIERVSSNNTANFFLWTDNSGAFGFGRDVYARVEQKHAQVPSVSVRALGIKDKDTVQKPEIDVKFSLDVVDMQSITFYRNVLFDKALVEGSDFGTYAVVHPMAVSGHNGSSGGGEEGEEEDGGNIQTASDHGGYIVHRVEVKKVFHSMAKPGILALSSYPPGSIILPEEQAAEERIEIVPRMIAKTGDNLINDMSVGLAFRIFNHIWRTDTSRFGGDSAKAPFSLAYDVLPTGEKAGLLEFLPGIEPLNDYDWAKWTEENAKNEEVLDSMLQSAAGASVATYVLGCGDRHWDNIQIRDGKTLLHIDFGMILGENPAFKTPRFSISAGMEKAFNDAGIWEPFVELCGAAFLSLRSRSAELMRLIALVLHHAGRPRAKILKYLASQPSLNIAEEDEKAAEKFVCDQVRSSSKNWETIMRKFTHDRVDPLFFKAVEMAPAGLVSAVEKMYDK